MKRSEVNANIRNADAFMKKQGFRLPPFAYWSPEAWTSKGDEVREIVENGLGWDITDFGSGDFEHCGLAIFTIRNGHPSNWDSLKGKLYCEKVFLIKETQVCPMHFHWRKMEDIINRGGATLMIQLYNATEDEEMADTDVVVSTDGLRRLVEAGGVIALGPGESITLPPRGYHKFWVEGGPVLAGEVSVVNDDYTDNRFYEPMGRFPEIEEDEPPLYLLVTDYERYYQPG
jgi:D-lyxose ketol-isomerase